ncbi:unnamed protein product [Didymodactylos carnosus]|uniref:Mitochondrial ATPase inhibitor n=1 Tax=Didymodactylos carnosus TaxID=1234261 RepID=A0A813TYY8_9BILA|nr:unnamed protein product [Didymodactylos carnosus]CAF1073787.1 unnamed protein product [Didymodactylos carnosus]CAF3607044.1 unnamed protein product [Didymodactylos carnosus]CAF3837813.1 unnamed protein product [Didymodactylos carnosus]
MLRTTGNILIKQASRLVVPARLSSTDPSAGSINAAHDKFAEREQALENVYFRKQNEELLTQLRKKHTELEKKSDDIEREQKRIEEEIKKLEKQREQLMKNAQKTAKQ